MMNIVWSIKHVDKKNFKIEDIVYENIITHVHWKCQVSNENKSDSISGTVPFDILELRYTNSRGEEVVYPAQFDPNNHIPYEDITDEHMVMWVKNFLGAQEVSRIESVISERITQI